MIDGINDCHCITENNSPLLNHLQTKPKAVMKYDFCGREFNPDIVFVSNYYSTGSVFLSRQGNITEASVEPNCQSLFGPWSLNLKQMLLSVGAALVSICMHLHACPSHLRISMYLINYDWQIYLKHDPTQTGKEHIHTN